MFNSVRSLIFVAELLADFTYFPSRKRDLATRDLEELGLSYRLLIEAVTSPSKSYCRDFDLITRKG